MLDLIWLIPLLPLVGVAVNGLLGRRLSLKAVGTIACLSVLLAFLLGAGAVWQLAQMEHGARYHEVSAGLWMPLGPIAEGERGFDVEWGFALDPLSAVMLLVVAGVGFLIHVYSVGYMAHEHDYARFFVYLNLFMSMMLMLVLGSNLLVLFVGWEGVGLCSYLLIGFFWDRPFDERTGLSCADAGRKAFVVNRIGDFAFLVGILYLALEFGTLDFRELAAAIAGREPAGWLLTGIGLLLFLGACGKSAQIPLYVWLPDAMAGPTPVSALIHAATMVTAGVYMVCRMSALYSHAPDALAIVAGVGALTALFAATMGVAATDIKKVLAYSTVSQLGFMFAAAGVGAYIAAIFHLMTHAFFKALLFLGSGSVIHGMHGEQDIRNMGGLRSKMPITFLTFLAGWLAIAGIPPLAGFFSKDEILAGAWFGGHRVIWAVLSLAALLTAFYMTRLVWLVFFGEFRGPAAARDKVHESPLAMTVPLMLLALLSVVGGWIGIPAVMSGWVGAGDVNAFHHWLEPAITPVGVELFEGGHATLHVPSSIEVTDVIPAVNLVVPAATSAIASPAVSAVEPPVLLPAGLVAVAGGGHDAGLESMLIVLATVVAVVGIGLAATIYRRPGLPATLARSSGPIYPMVRNLYWVDEFYEAAVLRPFYAFSRAFAAFDRWVVDGLVNAAGVSAEIAGQVVKLFQTGLVRNYALMILLGAVAIVYYILTWVPS